MPETLTQPKPAPASSSVPLLEIEGLQMHFPVHGGVLRRRVGSVKAVDGVDLRLAAGETLGLVGESGCGKSTLGKTIMRLHKPTAGRIRFDGRDLTGLGAGALRPVRRDLQMIFQDPAESLNSRFTVGEILAEPFQIHRIGKAADRRERVEALLERVSLPPAAADRFPHEFSGGQRQRLGIARAIALEPKLIVADEPVSALDVSVQSSVLNLMLELQREMGMAYLFIAHDLAVVRHISDRVAVMYLGRILELADADEIWRNPRHAYTKALLAAIPVADPTARQPRALLQGDVPSPIDPPPGCAFGHRMNHPDYPASIERDLSLVEVSPGHWVQPCPCCTDLG